MKVLMVLQGLSEINPNGVTRLHVRSHVGDYGDIRCVSGLSGGRRLRIYVYLI